MSGLTGGTDNKTYYDDQPATADILNTGGLNGALTVGTTAVEVKVGASKLAGRKCITLTNNSALNMYWGYSNAVTISNGDIIYSGQQATWAVGESVSIWVISSLVSQNARITEGG